MKTVVVGGGIIGLTVAYELRHRGADVILLEKETVGSGASGAAGGLLSPLYPWTCSEPTLRLLRLSERRWSVLFEALRAAGQASVPVSSGVLYTGAGSIAAARRWAGEQGREGWLLDRAALQQAVPGLAAAEGFLLAEMQQVVSRELLEGLGNLLRSEEVCIREHCGVDELIVRDRNVCGVISAGSAIEAECVVLCAGAWTARLDPGLVSGRVRPIRGQMIEIEAVRTVLPHVIVSDGSYLIPRPGGRMLVGSTVEDCGFNSGVTEQARQELLDFAECCLPALRHSVVKAQWAGLRPAPAGLEPLICRHPVLSGLFISTGHFRNGIALAAGSAQLVAEMVSGESPTLDIARFSVS